MRWLLLLALLANALFFIAQSKKQTDSVEVLELAENQAVGSIPAIRLLAELGSSGISRPQSARCEIIGPFANASELEAVKTKLAAEGFPSQKIPAAPLQSTPFWAHIAPQTDPAKLIEMLDSLRKAEIESYLLMYGDYLGSISLKYFTDSAGAAEFVRQLAQLGVIAEVIDLSNKNLNLWLKIPLKSGLFVPDWLNVDHPDKKTLKDNCDKVANGAQFH